MITVFLSYICSTIVAKRQPLPKYSTNITRMSMQTPVGQMFDVVSCR